MRKSVLIIISMFIAGAALYLYSHVEIYNGENGRSVIIETQSVSYDPVGIASDFLNRKFRNCKSVVPVVSGSTEWLSIVNVISGSEDFKGKEVIPLVVVRSGSWYLAEVNFTELEPAIFPIEEKGGNLVLHSSSLWSGHPGPLQAGPVIRSYFERHEKGIPKELVSCFSPSLEMFRW